MKDTLIAQIQSFTLQARAALESEAGRQLEGIYGWLPDGRFADTTHYPAVNEISEAAENRRRLESYAEEEKTAGLSPKDARIKLVREAAFTWLNRLVALRMMEERRIIRPTVGKLDKSNSFIFWLTADGNGEMYACHQKGALPQNAMGEGPSDMAYRKFLLSQCAQLARDVSVLFDPENLSSRLFPRPPVLKRIVESMNGEDLAEAWQTGNEETVGWVYQAFNAEELQAAFTAARLSKKKFEARDIPSVTQLFTIRWVVQFLVENTLGRLWVEMHPDSKLHDGLKYLVPFDGSSRALKPVQDITFLDPSCGSMHFGLVAFDIFVEMYREELENAGQEGWPDKASIASVDDIPASIIVNNIYGVDIDLRAVQLSALTLFLRARTLNKECAFSDRNLACANVEAITGGRLETFISQSKFSHPIYERILRGMATSLKDSDQLGSLLRLERTLEYLIAEERKKVDAKKQLKFSFPGVSQEQFATREGVQEFFDILYEQLLRHLDNFVKESRDRKLNPGHFASETAKGLRFLGIVSSRYDVVATNPPYLYGRKMNKRLAELLKDQYPEGKADLYAAFILRCQELARQHGFVGMLTMHSFMFISSYENMRNTLRDQVCVETLAHFGGGLFAVGNPGTLQTAAHVLRKEVDSKKMQENQGTYFRLVGEKDSEAKRIAFEDALASLKYGRPHPLLFTCRKKDFDAIPRKPWAYFISNRVRDLFKNFDPLDKIGLPRQGAKTTDNYRFLRYWWEVGRKKILLSCDSHQEAIDSGNKWFFYVKGGSLVRWYGNYHSVVNWEKSGAEIKDVINKKRLNYTPNAKGDLWGAWLNSYDYYFKKGIVYSYLSSANFSARLLPSGCIFDVAASGIFSDQTNLLLSILNSKLGKYLLTVLNPTVNFAIGDLCRLPIPLSDEKDHSESVELAIKLGEAIYRKHETSHNFVRPYFEPKERDVLNNKLAEIEQSVDNQVLNLYKLDEQELEIIEGASSIIVKGEENEDELLDESKEKDSPDEIIQESLALTWLSYALGMVLGRYDIGVPEGLGRGDFDEKTVAAILALTDEDGVMVSQPGHPQDISARTLKCLELMRGQEIAHALIREAAAGSGGDPEGLLRDFLDRFTGTPEASFWRHHLQLYRKRPIFWPLQAPKRKFTVWVFQERFTRDTLFKVRSEFADPKGRWLEVHIRELKAKAETSAGAEKRKAEKEASQLADILDDVQEFTKRLNAIIQKGYTPRFDDGVLINAAPLWELLPSWTDTKKTWQELEDGKYDWAHQAMDHWPGRVKEKCKTNKSFTIAHGLEELCEG